MSFQPVVPIGGLAGLRLLDATAERQLDTFSRRPDIQRAADAFITRAGEITSAEELVADRELLSVALSAFGLEDEINKRALIRRVLEEGTLDPDSLANKLVDPAWRRFSETLGLDFGNRLVLGDVRREVADAFVERQFERAVGDQDVNLRLALNFRREIETVAGEPGVERAGWFRVIGSEPLRRVVFGALGLPDSFGALDVDAQADRLSERARQVFGGDSPAIFTDASVREDAVSRFLLRAEAEAGLGAGGGTLGGGALGGGAIANLILSGIG
ncbi:MAG: DUF1217 domain-containing protein [Pseudomonadota bacterium]